MNPEEPLTQKLQAFKCQRCNECCQKPGNVYMSETDIQAASQYLGISEFDFVNKFCNLQDRQKVVLKKGKAESCIFLKPDGCSIQKAKPQQCRGFPVKWRTPASLEYCAGLKKINL